MGQKIHPIGFRLGVIESWRSRWYASRDRARFFGEDTDIRRFVKTRLPSAGITKVEIERAASRVKINIFSAKPGIVIGKKGKDIEDLRRDLRKVVNRDVSLNIIEIRKADMDAQLVAEQIAFQLERRVSFKRVIKEAAARARRAGAEGVKVWVAGRLNGSEIARAEEFKDGPVPLHTLRAEIDYATAEAFCTYGVIGVKVWIFKGERFGEGETVPLESVQL